MSKNSIFARKSKKAMAGTSAVIKEGEQKIARIIYNHKKAAFVYTPQ